ncbi:MAG: glycosyltransferase 87 family protein [Streptosporangiaceae bacterium]
MNSKQLSVPVRRPVAHRRGSEGDRDRLRMDSADGPPVTQVGRAWPHAALGGPSQRAVRWKRTAVVLAGLAALTVYLRPGLAAPHAHWPLWDVHVYWWGGQQATRGGTLYAPGTRYSFTYPPFAAALFTLAAHAPEGDLAAVITAASIGALAVLCALSLGTAGVQRRPETVFAVTALALLTWPVAYTLHLGEINLILAALAGTDLLRRHDGHWWQGIATGLAAGIKLTPLIFVAYLLITRRVRAAATAAGTFAVTVAIGVVLLPSQSRVFWLDGVFDDQDRIGDPANLSDQSLSGAVARLAGSLDSAYWWWAIAALLVGLAGIMVGAWAHRRGHQLAGVSCCAITGLLISPFSWTHHWVWAAPLLVALAVTAWRRRSAGYGLATAAAAAVFSGRIPLSGPGQPPGPVRLLEGDLYVLCGLAVLAGMALALVREQAQTASRPDKAARTLRPGLSIVTSPRSSRPGRGSSRRTRLPRATRRRSRPLPAAVGAVLAQVDAAAAPPPTASARSGIWSAGRSSALRPRNPGSAR